MPRIVFQAKARTRYELQSGKDHQHQEQFAVLRGPLGDVEGNREGQHDVGQRHR